MANFVGLRPKIYNDLKDDGGVDKKAKGLKKCVIKQRLKFEGYKNSLENNEIIIRS